MKGIAIVMMVFVAFAAACGAGHSGPDRGSSGRVAHCHVPIGSGHGVLRRGWLPVGHHGVYSVIERLRQWRRGDGRFYYCNLICALSDQRWCRPKHRLALWLSRHTRWLR
jgi:hypothetical protein